MKCAKVVPESFFVAITAIKPFILRFYAKQANNATVAAYL